MKEPIWPNEEQGWRRWALELVLRNPMIFHGSIFINADVVAAYGKDGTKPTAEPQ